MAKLRGPTRAVFVSKVAPHQSRRVTSTQARPLYPGPSPRLGFLTVYSVHLPRNHFLPKRGVAAPWLDGAGRPRSGPTSTFCITQTLCNRCPETCARGVSIRWPGRLLKKLVTDPHVASHGCTNVIDPLIRPLIVLSIHQQPLWLTHRRRHPLLSVAILACLHYVPY